MSHSSEILIAGIGNIFFGDDAFGCEVVRELTGRSLPENVRVVDYGIRSYDLAYALMDRYAATILIDAVRRGHAPGTLYLIEPEMDVLASEQFPDGHSMTPASVLRMAKSLGGEPANIYLVGCEPSTLESEEGQMDLSDSVCAAVPRAAEMIEQFVSDLLRKLHTDKSIVSRAEI
jgi:hydrogenase maturation protease